MTPYRRPQEPEKDPPKPVPPRTLGDKKSSHRVYTSSRVPLVLWLVITLMFAGVTVVHPHPFAIAVTLILFLMLVLLGGLSQWALGMGPVVELYDDGIVVRRSWTETVTLFFEDIDSLFYDFEVLSRFGARISPTVKLTLVTHDEKRVVLPRGLRDMNAINKELDRKVVRPLLAPAKRAVDEGEIMKFGLIEVDHEGLEARGERYAWKDIARIEAQPDSFTIHANENEKDRRITSVPVREIPHPRVLVVLLRLRCPVESPPGFWGE